MKESIMNLLKAAPKNVLKVGAITVAAGVGVFLVGKIRSMMSQVNEEDLETDTDVEIEAFEGEVVE